MSGEKDLKREINDFVYENVMGKELYGLCIQERQTLSTFCRNKVTHMRKHGDEIKDTRQFANLDARKKMRITAARYRRVFKIVGETRHPRKIFREVEQIANIERRHRFINGTFWTGEGSPYTLENLWDVG